MHAATDYDRTGAVVFLVGVLGVMRSIPAFASCCLLAAALSVAVMAQGLADDAVPADCSAAHPPDRPAAGDVLGKPVDVTNFVVTGAGTVTINGQALALYQLEFASDNEGTPDVEFRITFALKPGEALDGKTLRRVPGLSMGEQPGPAKGAPEIQGWAIDDHPERVKLESMKDDAAIRLEFAGRKDNALLGRLWLCVPARQTAVGGSFEAQVGN
jgi:hypothetical protein